MQFQKTYGLVELLKENMLLRAEVASLTEILTIAETTGQLSADWRVLLKEARQTQAYRDVAEQYDTLFKQIEDVADTTGIDDLLQAVPFAELVK